MGILRKFALALGSMLALILFVAVVGFVALEVLERKAGDIVADSMRMQRLALEVDSRLQLARQAERDFVVRIKDLGVDGARAAYANEFSARLGEAGRNVAWLQDMERFSVGKSESVQSSAKLEELSKSIESYAEHFRLLVGQAAISGRDTVQFENRIGSLDAEYLHLTSLVRQLAISATNAARNAHDGIATSSQFVKYTLVVAVLFALLLAASIIWVLNKTVAESVVKLSDNATELSLGNLDARVDIPGSDEFGQLADSMNSMAERITLLVDDLAGQASVASHRLMEAIDSVSEGFLLFDKKEHLVLANRRVHGMCDADPDFFRPGLAMEDLCRHNASSGLFLNAIGREEEWVRDMKDFHRKGESSIEEPLSDGRWIHLKTYHTDRGEVVTLLTDITERKLAVQDLSSMNSDLEELVRQRTHVLVEKAIELKNANKRLRELDELKSAFLSSVSHELRTPLTSLLGFSKIIRRDFNRNFAHLASDDKTARMSDRIQTNLDIIGSEGERLTRLINDVLDLSRIESGQEDWRFAEVDLGGAINRAVSAASGLFSPKPHVKLNLRRVDPVPVVHCDPDRLHQVIINLLSNAAKFTEVGEVAVDLYVDEYDMIRIRVEDTGAGIADRYLDRIFDKFHQAHRGDTLTEKPSGTGLGLAISRQIIEKYDGRIWAESKLKRGTIINISLPPAELPDRPLVLVVDDDAAVRDFLSMNLKKAGYGVRTACDGRQALAMIARKRPALVSMDIRMPGMDGRTAIELMREKPEFSDIPILVVSVVEDCAEMGGNAALLKPVKGEAFIAAVDGLLGESKSSHPVIALSGGGASCSLPGMNGETVTHCSEQEMWQMLERGFEGTVVVPESMVENLDLRRISNLPQVQVVLLPGLSVTALQ